MSPWESKVSLGTHSLQTQIKEVQDKENRVTHFYRGRNKVQNFSEKEAHNMLVLKQVYWINKIILETEIGL